MASMSDVHHRMLENMYRSAPVTAVYDASLRVGPGTAEVVIPVKQAFFHAAGALHGSVYFKLLDDACFFAVSSLVEDVFVLTVSFTTYFTRSVAEGRLAAVGRAVHAGKNLFLGEATLTRADGEIVARGSGSFMRSQISLTPDIGYRP
jgi:uncharacterized protein (TIGR00369 family)